MKNDVITDLSYIYTRIILNNVQTNSIFMYIKSDINFNHNYKKLNSYAHIRTSDVKSRAFPSPQMK